jgi:hypothetical protein
LLPSSLAWPAQAPIARAPPTATAQSPGRSMQSGRPPFRVVRVRATSTTLPSMALLLFPDDTGSLGRCGHSATASGTCGLRRRRERCSKEGKDRWYCTVRRDMLAGVPMPSVLYLLHGVASGSLLGVLPLTCLATGRCCSARLTMVPTVPVLIVSVRPCPSSRAMWARIPQPVVCLSIGNMGSGVISEAVRAISTARPYLYRRSRLRASQGQYRHLIYLRQPPREFYTLLPVCRSRRLTRYVAVQLCSLHEAAGFVPGMLQYPFPRRPVEARPARAFHQLDPLHLSLHDSHASQRHVMALELIHKKTSSARYYIFIAYSYFHGTKRCGIR